MLRGCNYGETCQYSHTPHVATLISEIKRLRNMKIMTYDDFYLAIAASAGTAFFISKTIL